jgi:uncharacterized protein YdhG (YjbR/CyaY superfamily)
MGDRARRDEFRAGAESEYEMADGAKTVDDYLEGLPAKERAVLEQVREAIRSAAPQAEEKISYRIPMYTHHGHLVGFAAFKDHLSLFVTNSEVPERFAKELGPFRVEHTTIRFTVDKPLPAALVKRIVKARVAENEARVASR